jgi:hypothetical protein
MQLESMFVAPEFVPTIRSRSTFPTTGEALATADDMIRLVYRIQDMDKGRSPGDDVRRRIAGLLVELAAGRPAVFTCAPITIGTGFGRVPKFQLHEIFEITPAGMVSERWVEALCREAGLL